MPITISCCALPLASSGWPWRWARAACSGIASRGDGEIGQRSHGFGDFRGDDARPETSRTMTWASAGAQAAIQQERFSGRSAGAATKACIAFTSTVSPGELLVARRAMLGRRAGGKT